MSTLIGIIFGIVFLVFLGKAICETIYGVTLMIIGLTLMGFSKILDGIVWVGKNLRNFEKPQIIAFQKDWLFKRIFSLSRYW